MVELSEREFKPSPRMKRIYWLYSLWYFAPMLILVFGIGFANIEPDLRRSGWNIASRQVIESIVVNLITPLVFLIVIPAIVFGVWVSLYYRSIVFRVEDDHVYSRRGIWWVKEKRVPYNLVSEVRLRQGPLQRRLGLANVDVFTPATGVRRPELSLFQVDEKRAREVLSYLRYRTGILSAKERRVIEEDILREIREIKKLLKEIRDRL